MNNIKFTDAQSTTLRTQRKIS